MTATVPTAAQAIASCTTTTGVCYASWDLMQVCAEAEIARGAVGLARRLVDARAMTAAVGRRNAGSAIGALVGHLLRIAREDDRIARYGTLWM